jgi:hypothetical protein
LLHVRRVVRRAGAGEAVQGGGQFGLVAVVEGVDAAYTEADGDAAEQLAVVEAADSARGWVEEEVLIKLRGKMG